MSRASIIQWKTAWSPCHLPASLSFWLSRQAHTKQPPRNALAKRIIAILRAHETELRQAGILHLSLFGSVARDEPEAASDIDLAAEFDPTARMDLFPLTALESRLGEILGRRVDLLFESTEKARLRANVDRDRRRAF
jgi:predicted nucleotidyltransferase